MESANQTSRPAILEKAWMHHAELDTNADRLSKRHLNLRKWVLILGIMATILAIITDMLNAQCPAGLSTETCTSMRAILKVLLILTPLIGSMIAAFTSRELGDGRWLSMRAGAEEIKKEIYIYRTVLQHHPDRNKWLSNRLAYIQRQIFKASGRRLDTVPYNGALPLYFSPDNPNSDPGFTDLTPDDYMKHRLQEQLSWHEGRIVRLSKAKRNLTIAILLAGVAGALLAALGGTFAVWVALTAAITASLTGWEELRNRDKTILNYSKVKLELAIIRDYWYSLSAEEHTDTEFYKMVLAAENVMFAQNGEWLRSMQEALAGVEDEDKKLVEEMVALSATTHAELQQKLLTESQMVFAQAAEQLSAVADDAAATVSGMVTAVSTEAMALNQMVGESVDAAASEAAAARHSLEASRDAALQEAAAWRETAQEGAAAAAAQSAAAREAAREEAAAWGETAQDAVDTAVAQSTAIRGAARAATTAEAIAWGQAAQEAAAMAAAQSAAARDSMAETAETIAAEADATRLALETSRDEALTEASAWRETAQESAADAIAGAAAVREDAAAAVAAETAAWAEAAEGAVDTAVAQSAAARDAAATAVVAETAAWSEAAQDIVDTAATQSTAARDVAAAEAAAWGEMAQEVVDTAVSEAAALREKAGEQVKYAVTFAPVAAAIEEVGTAVTEQWANVSYEAVPDIKYPVQFTPAQPPAAENGEPAAPPDASVDAAVDRLLEAGVQVADDAIKQALAKAAQDENS